MQESLEVPETDIQIEPQPSAERLPHISETFRSLCDQVVSPENRAAIFPRLEAERELLGQSPGDLIDQLSGAGLPGLTVTAALRPEIGDQEAAFPIARAFRRAADLVSESINISVEAGTLTAEKSKFLIAKFQALEQKAHEFHDLGIRLSQRNSAATLDPWKPRARQY